MRENEREKSEREMKEKQITKFLKIFLRRDLEVVKLTKEKNRQ